MQQALRILPLIRCAYCHYLIQVWLKLPYPLAYPVRRICAIKLYSYYMWILKWQWAYLIIDLVPHDNGAALEEPSTANKRGWSNCSPAAGRYDLERGAFAWIWPEAWWGRLFILCFISLLIRLTTLTPYRLRNQSLAIFLEMRTQKLCLESSA